MARTASDQWLENIRVTGGDALSDKYFPQGSPSPPVSSQGTSGCLDLLATACKESDLEDSGSEDQRHSPLARPLPATSPVAAAREVVAREVVPVAVLPVEAVPVAVIPAAAVPVVAQPCVREGALPICPPQPEVQQVSDHQNIAL